MSEIAQAYIDTKKASKVAEEAFDEALKREFGPTATVWNTPGKTEWNEEILAAFNAMHVAIDAACRARGIANANGGDFALPNKEYVCDLELMSIDELSNMISTLTKNLTILTAPEIIKYCEERLLKVNEIYARKIK